MSQQTLTLNNAEDLQVVLEGCPRPLLLKPALSKAGNVYWALPSASRFGAAIRPQADSLPESFRVVNPKTKKESAPVSMLVGVTEDRRQRTSGAAKMTLPVRTNPERKVQVTISIRKDGTWNVKASAFGVGGGGATVLKDDSILG